MKLEYIWIDGNNDIRSKTKIYNKEIKTAKDIPIWNYDGSSTKQATGSKSEVFIRPCAIYKDPFRKESTDNYLVLCDTLLPDHTPHPTNTRVKAAALFDKNIDSKPLFGIEQEFFLFLNEMPIGFDKQKYKEIKKQGDYYCGVGTNNSDGRVCAEEILDNCLYAGLSITGMNAEVAPSQWELQICDYGIKASDQLYILRYIIKRTAEKYNWTMNIHPKPLSGNWNGSGCHVNFSNEKMRNDNGYDDILKCISNLEKNHTKHIELYGEDNKERLSGLHETSSYNTFIWDVANRETSIRIPSETMKNKKGYFEDRRPSSNMDPYIVTSLIFECSLY